MIAVLMLPFRSRIVPELRRVLTRIQKSKHRIVIFIGLFDALLLGTAPLFILCAISVSGPLSILREMIIVVAAYPLSCLIPLALLIIVGWRGSADARRIINSRDGYLRPATEGFLPCFMFPVTEFLGELFPIAYAGIPLYVEASSMSLTEWFSLIVRVLWDSCKIGALGAALASLLDAANRLIIKRLILKGSSPENSGPCL